jgi:excisionase family DNA binding protein
VLRKSDEHLFTITEAAKKLQISRSTIDRMVRGGDLAVIRIGSGRGRPRVPESELAAYLARARQRGRVPS